MVDDDDDDDDEDDDDGTPAGTGSNTRLPYEGLCDCDETFIRLG